MVGLLVGVTVTDGGCVAFTERGTLPRDIDIASGKNDFCDETFVDMGLLGKLPPVLIPLFFTDDVELDGELVFVIVKLGVIFMLACEFCRLAARISAYTLGELAARTLVIADGIWGSVDLVELLAIFNGAATMPDCICGNVDFGEFGKLFRDCIGLEPTFGGAFLFGTLALG